jgi:hypothetical protein
MDKERLCTCCRLKASLERLQRLTQSYADAMIDIFPQRASQLGQALGLDQDRVTVSQLLMRTGLCKTVRKSLFLYKFGAEKLPVRNAALEFLIIWMR